MKNSELVLNQTEIYQYALEVQGYGNLLSENVRVSSKYDYYIIAHPSSKVLIQNSSALFTYVRTSFSKVTANNLGGGYIHSFSTFKNLTVTGGSAGNLTILNSFLSLGFELYECELTVSNSTLHGIKALRSKLSVSNCEWQPDGTIVYLDNSKAEIHDSRLSFVVSHNDSMFVIYNSTIFYRLHFLEGHGQGSCFESQIGYIEAESFRGTLVANETVILGGPGGSAYLKIIDSQFYVFGGISFLSGSCVGEWKDSNVTRNFEVFVMNGTVHNAASNVEIVLLTQNNTAIWEGLTDSLGKASFNLTFSDNNYTSALRIELAKKGYSGAANVSFLSGAPIVLNMRYFTDLNGDGIVNIVDIAIVARNYGSKIGDPNWDETADLDKNGKIDIIDVATVARDYGKTV
jgi:hypothetical protein